MLYGSSVTDAVDFSTQKWYVYRQLLHTASSYLGVMSDAKHCMHAKCKAQPVAVQSL